MEETRNSQTKRITVQEIVESYPLMQLESPPSRDKSPFMMGAMPSIERTFKRAGEIADGAVLFPMERAL